MGSFRAISGNYQGNANHRQFGTLPGLGILPMFFLVRGNFHNLLDIKVKVKQDMHKHNKVLCDAINLRAMQQVLA